MAAEAPSLSSPSPSFSSPSVSPKAPSRAPHLGAPSTGSPESAAPAIERMDGPDVPHLSPQDSADFVLHPTEMAKGRNAAERYLSTCKNEEARRDGEEALETLATVISGGRCASLDFPWQQVQPYHGAAALTILKEKGAPSRIEALRCRRDSTRSYRVMPESYPPRQVQRIRNALSKVIDECCELGYVAPDEPAAQTVRSRAGSARTSKARASARKRRSSAAPAAGKGRILADGELRALSAACTSDGSAEGARDAVLFALVHRGLRIAEITGLTLESVRFSNKTGRCNIVTRPARSGGRGRRVGLTNDELICLEDWLDLRGDGKGPLLCTIGRGGRIEGKRLTTAMLKGVCEQRASQAKVAPFGPNDLSRSADALVEHRKAARKRSARRAREAPSVAEQVLFESEPRAPGSSETIRFPFLGLQL